MYLYSYVSNFRRFYTSNSIYLPFYVKMKYVMGLLLFPIFVPLIPLSLSASAGPTLHEFQNTFIQPNTKCPISHIVHRSVLQRAGETRIPRQRTPLYMALSCGDMCPHSGRGCSSVRGVLWLIVNSLCR